MLLWGLQLQIPTRRQNNVTFVFSVHLGWEVKIIVIYITEMVTVLALGPSHTQLHNLYASRPLLLKLEVLGGKLITQDTC